MADGTSKPIEDVEVGDQVLATDPETGETSAQTVTAEITGSGLKNLVTLTVRTEDGDTAEITATDEHPFWVPAANAWITATDLTPGTHLTTADATPATVTTITRRPALALVHNLTIQDVHTYYVLAGETPVLVHNSNCRTDLNWNPRSRPTFGHTFSEHGAGAANTRSLTDRARSTGNPQGQWLDNDAATDFLRSAYDAEAGARRIPIPEGLGQVIRPDGSIVRATHAILVPGRNGGYRTAYPITP